MRALFCGSLQLARTGKMEHLSANVCQVFMGRAEARESERVLRESDFFSSEGMGGCAGFRTCEGMRGGVEG